MTKNNTKQRPVGNQLHTHDFGCDIWQVQVILDIPNRRPKDFTSRPCTENIATLTYLKQRFENINHSCHICCDPKLDLCCSLKWISGQMKDI